VRDAARTENGFAGFELHALVANLKGHFAFQNVKPLVLVEVQMQRRAARHKVAVLDDKEIPGRVGREHLEGERAEAHGVRRAEAVCASRNDVDFRSGRLRKS